MSSITIEVLPASYGDSLLVTCPLPQGEWRLLIDTGPDECWPSLKSRLERLQADRDGRRHIDLAIISHIDHDHIGAARALFDDQSLGLSFGDIWFNAPPPRAASRGVAEGRSLAALLGASREGLPWNLAWNGKPAVTTAERLFVELPSEPGRPKLTLLSPTPETLTRLFAVWEAAIKKLGHSEEPEPAPGGSRGAVALDVKALAATRTAMDHAPANGSSIALLLEHQGASVVLAADAFAPVLADALRALAEYRQVSLPWRFDAFKLSHHGSRANITSDLFQVLQAKHYLVSTNGAVFGHPNAEAIARVVMHGGTDPSLWFNYKSSFTEKWADAALQAQHHFSAVFPQPGQSGFTVSVGGLRHR